MVMKYSSLFETQFGHGIVFASEKGVSVVTLPSPEANNVNSVRANISVSSEITEAAAKMLNGYFKGLPQNFAILPVDLDAVSPLRARILQLIRSIPFGQIRSYGDVAEMAGIRGGARAVGGAMASNPVPIIIPCHRVVGANGKLTGFTAPGGLKLKKKLLEMESIEFKGEVVRQKIDNYKQKNIGMKIIMK